MAGDAFSRLAEWTGRSETREDVITPAPVAALAATLDRDDPPPGTATRARLAHWLYFLPTPASRASAPTATRSAAASCRRCRCRAACGRAGASSSSRRSRRRAIAARFDASSASSRSTAAAASWSSSPCSHEVCDRRGRAIGRSTTSSIAAPRRRGRRMPRRPLRPDVASQTRARPGDAVPLLRADRQRPPHPLRLDYVTGDEGYPGLVVHGPLQATLMVDLCRRNARAAAQALLLPRLPPALRHRAVHHLRRTGCRREFSAALDARRCRRPHHGSHGALVKKRAAFRPPFLLT